MGERKNNILSWISDIYTIDIIFYCMVNIFVDKFHFYHYVDWIDLCIFTGIGLFSYIGQNQLSVRIGENYRVIVTIAGLLIAAIAIYGTQGYENFSTLLRYLGCVVLIYLAWQSTKIEECDRSLVLKMEVMIGFVVLAAILVAVRKENGISQIYFVIAILLNLMCLTNAHVFYLGRNNLKIKVWVGIIYGSGLLICGLWIFLNNKVQTLCVIVGKKMIVWIEMMLLHVKQTLFWVYQHIGAARKEAMPFKGVEENYEIYEDGGIDVTIGVVIIIALAVLALTLLFVLIWEIFKKWRTVQRVKAQKHENTIKEKNKDSLHSLALWVGRRKLRRIGPKRFLYRLMKLCKRTECRMRASDTPKSFIEKVTKAYVSEGTTLRQKMNDMAIEINRCYYAKEYSNQGFSNQEASKMLKEIKRAIKKRKKIKTHIAMH